jgi:hypothetical protein
MGTNIDIDDELMAKQLLVKLKSQKAIRAARGKLQWDCDLEAMRLGQ